MNSRLQDTDDDEPNVGHAKNEREKQDEQEQIVRHVAFVDVGRFAAVLMFSKRFIV